MGKKYLSRDEILNANDLVVEELDVPEWGGKLRVKSLTGAERDKFEASVIQQTGKSTKVKLENARARLASMTIVDEDGKRMFSEQDVARLTQKNGAALSRVFNVATRLSGISDEDMEELTKNLSDDQPEDLPSD